MMENEQPSQERRAVVSFGLAAVLIVVLRLIEFVAYLQTQPVELPFPEPTFGLWGTLAIASTVLLAVGFHARGAPVVRGLWRALLIQFGTLAFGWMLGFALYGLDLLSSGIGIPSVWRYVWYELCGVTLVAAGLQLVPGLARYGVWFGRFMFPGVMESEYPFRPFIMLFMPWLLVFRMLGRDRLAALRRHGPAVVGGILPVFFGAFWSGKSIEESFWNLVFWTMAAGSASYAVAVFPLMMFQGVFRGEEDLADRIVAIALSAGIVLLLHLGSYVTTSVEGTMTWDQVIAEDEYGNVGERIGLVTKESSRWAQQMQSLSEAGDLAGAIQAGFEGWRRAKQSGLPDEFTWFGLQIASLYRRADSNLDALNVLLTTRSVLKQWGRPAERYLAPLDREVSAMRDALGAEAFERLEAEVRERNPGLLHAPDPRDQEGR